MIAQVDKRYISTRPYKLFSRLLGYVLFEGRPLTTKGQWINPLIFSHFALEKRLPAFKRVKDPVFILGTGRSGTTILGIVLSMHREVGFLNEPKALWHAIYPDEDLIGSYSRGIARYRLDDSDVTKEVTQAAHRLYGAYLATTFSRRVVDKYPELIFRVPFVKAIFPDSKFLFLVRNGWDTCHSIEAWSNRLGKKAGEETHDWWGRGSRKWKLLVNQLVPKNKDLAPFQQEMASWTNQTDMAAVEWIISMREGIKILQEYPDSVLRVNYESLCLQPRQTLKTLARYLNLSDDDVFLDYGSKTLQPVYNKKPIELHSAIMGPFLETMRELGYDAI